MRWPTLEQAVVARLRRAPAAAEQPTRNWAYCLATNAELAHASEEQRQALLAELRA